MSQSCQTFGPSHICINITRHLLVTHIQNQKKNIWYNIICTSAHFQIPFLSSNKHTEKKYYKPEVDPNRFFNMWTALLRKTQQQHPSSVFMNCFSILSRLMRSPYLQALPIPVAACLTRQTNYTISSSNHILCLKSGICSAEQKMSSSRALWWVLKNSLNGFTSVICTCGKVVFLVNLINMIE